MDNSFDIYSISKLVKSVISNIYTITETSGVEIDGNGKYFEIAKRVAEKSIIKQKDNIYWKPIVINNVTLGTIGIKINKKSIDNQIELLDGLINEISYETFLKEQSIKYNNPKSTFIKELLETDVIKNFDQAIDKADILGLNLRSQQAVLIIEVPGLYKNFYKKFNTMQKDKIDILINKECKKIISDLKMSFKNYEQNIFTCFGPNKFIVLKWAKGQINTLNTVNFYKSKAKYISETIKKYTGITPTIGVGQYYPGLSGLRKSFMDAQSSLTLGKKIWGDEKIYHITDVGMYMALSSNITVERKCELAHQIIGKLFDEPSLYKTVEIFLNSDMNLTIASKKLHLHRNTLIYRLDKIKKEIGLDPRKFSDAIQIKLGILLYSPKSKNC